MPFVVLGLVGATLGTMAPAVTNSAEDLVDTAKAVVGEMLIDPDFKFMRQMIRNARATVIIPELFKGGFITGTEGGSAVILARRAADSWSQPAFHTLLSGSTGLQIGGQVSKPMLIVRNERAPRKIVEDNVQFGADLSITVGPVGVGAKGATTANLDAGIVTFSKNKDLFSGGAFEVGEISSNSDRHELFHGRPVTGRTILYMDQVRNTRPDGLRRSLSDVA